eukprot:TRINITY_DN6554_c0_g1_i1.p1 TRINITY_DN6554_c0_g1~~TRINITY_DN6554_c0_g1_i1.p1  ORF type:complete len:945 (+),score=173.31 TRINITY_DN6554_c0_g1_i1:1-2835(+)
MDARFILIFLLFSLYVSGDYIVMFNEYLSVDSQLDILEGIIPLSSFHWEYKPRNISYPQSDFAVIDVSELDRELTLEKLKSDSNVKHIIPQKKLRPKLQFNDVESEEPVHIHTFNQSYIKLSGRPHTKIPREEVSVPYSRRLQSNNYDVADLLDAPYLWKFGYTGKKVKVAVFDTGLGEHNSYFNNVKEIVDWTTDEVKNDYIGHGTFVAGVIASNNPDCKGIAPDVELYVFKIFTNEQVSYTTWFLDAFNYAIYLGIDVLNLSIGGPDFNDHPFVEKILELSANNVIVVSAIGNDGPTYGSLNNPADQSDVIGVGGVDFSGNIASFSSRGMTTWEMPSGIGRFKPDIVTFSKDVISTHNRGGCTSLSGTSVASPIVAGATALLLSSVPPEDREKVNPASMKQILMESSYLYTNSEIWMEGAGQLSLVDAFSLLREYTPKVTSIPSHIDLTSTYMYPYNLQPLYYSSIPTKLNITLLNGMSVSSTITETNWLPGINGQHIEISFSHSDVIWPWSGYLSLHIRVLDRGEFFEGDAEGVIKVTIKSPPSPGTATFRYTDVEIPLKVKIVPTPSREKRVLWDQYHSIGYPRGYYPRDALLMKSVPFDWNGDHPFTNFHLLFKSLREQGYFLEILGEPLTCFDSINYGTLMIVDPERDFHQLEIEKVQEDIKEGMSLVVLADWYDTELLDKLKIMDENTQQMWIPITGGANIPAVNELLETYGIAFGDRVYDGAFTLSKTGYFASGNAIMSFPKDGILVPFELLDQSNDMINSKRESHIIPVLGFYQPGPEQGRISVFGDSSCFDEANQLKESDCLWLLKDIMSYASEGSMTPSLQNYEPLQSAFKSKRLSRPVRYGEKSNDELSECENLHFVKNNLTFTEGINWDTGKQIHEHKGYFRSKVVLHNFNTNIIVIEPAFIPLFVMLIALIIFIAIILFRRLTKKSITIS